MEDLNIYEMNYSCSPGGVDGYEVYTAETFEIVGKFVTLADAVDFCYKRGVRFTVHPLEVWEREHARA